MPSFDVVSQVDQHELGNAIDQANRELDKRFDFRGSDAAFTRDGATLTLEAPSEFQLKQMQDILRARLAARRIDLRAVEFGAAEVNLARARLVATIRQGIDQALAKQLIAALKQARLKVEAQINADKLRVSGKQKDELQRAIALLRSGEYGRPLQFENFRD